MLNKPPLTELGDDIVAHAKAIYADSGPDEELMIIFYALTPAGLMILPTAWGNELEKAQLIALLRKMFVVHNVTSYIVLSEAWMRTNLDDYTEKREVCLVSGADIDGNTYHRRFSLDRSGDHVVMIEEQPHEKEEMAGTMLGLLKDPPKVTEEERTKILGLPRHEVNATTKH